jgi:hypothetical protein
METLTPETPELHDSSIVDDQKPQPFEILKPAPYYTEITTEEELQEKYLTLTTELIDKIAGNEDEPGYDTVIFLDKSARPLSWIIRKMWKEVAPQRLNNQTKSLEVVPMPSMKFANIDRLHWRKDPSKEIDDAGMLDITQSDIEGLREIYQTGSKNTLDGKRILIVDEQSESGDTLKVAKILFSRAFPDSDVDGTPWIRHSYSIDSKGQKKYNVKEIPVWYPPKNSQALHAEDGRGVGNPKEYSDQNPAHGPRFSPNSYKFLSTLLRQDKINYTVEERLRLAELRQMSHNSDLNIQQKLAINSEIKSITTELDPKSIKLREEVSRMVGRFVAGELFPRVPTDRSTILGTPARAYNLSAMQIRSSRKFSNLSNR